MMGFIKWSQFSETHKERSCFDRCLNCCKKTHRTRWTLALHSGHSCIIVTNYKKGGINYSLKFCLHLKIHNYIKKEGGQMRKLATTRFQGLRE